MQILASAMAFSMLGLAYGAVQSVRARNTMQWLMRTRAEQAARDIIASALAEATHELMEDANRPGSPLFEPLRTARAVQFVPGLARTRARFAGRDLAIASAVVTVGDARPLHPDVPFEWKGAARIAVTVEALAPSRFSLQGADEREVRAACVAPVPFDRAIRLDVNRPLSEAEPPLPLPAAQLALTPPPARQPVSLWRARATLAVEPDAQGRVQPAFDVLLRRLGRVSGVVLVDNAGRAPLVLRGLAWRGQAILAVTGPVEIADVRLADPAVDLLSVVAFGDASLDGAIEAAVILTEPEEGAVAERATRPRSGSEGARSAPSARRPARRRAGAGTRIRGAYVVTAGLSPLPPSARVDPLETLVATDPRGTVRGDRIHVAVSPHLSARTIGGLQK